MRHSLLQVICNLGISVYGGRQYDWETATYLRRFSVNSTDCLSRGSGPSTTNNKVTHGKKGSFDTTGHNAHTQVKLEFSGQ